MSDPGGIVVAGRTPDNEWRPESLDALRTIVREAGDLTLIPIGAGTQLDLGFSPAGPFAAVHLSDALSGPIEHERDDLTVVVPGGATLGAIDAVLSAAGQRLPIDPPRAELATIGGTLASGLSGPLRSRYGPPKDFVLGMTLLRPDGDLVKAGGRVVKNVTGYDMMRVWCGSLGTFGIITEVTLRVFPVPPTVDLVAPVASVEDGITLVDRAYRADLRPEIADILVEGRTVRAVLRVHERAAAGIMKLAPGAVPGERALFRRCRDAGFEPTDALAVRANTTFATLPAAASALAALRPDTLVVRPLAGFVRAAWTVPAAPATAELGLALRDLRARLAPLGGGVVVDRMPARCLGQIDPWGEPPPSLGLMRKLKAAYDPGGRFNRGRYLGGL